ncbi:MAG: hypothetical protein L3J59_02370 [Methylococcaceae bacterium]|nr:hypothetical protein [Methylococcaceae bacterium]
MNRIAKISLLAFSVSFTGSAWALSPPNINTDIPWTDTGGVSNPSAGVFDATFNGVADIAEAFNHARRQEEIQRGLAVNMLGNLNLPSQIDWDNMTDDAKALMILNAERIDRVDIGGNIREYGFAGIESHIDNITKIYGDVLHDSDATGHSADGNTPFGRIDQNADIGVNALGAGSDCHEFINRAENLAYFATTGSSIPLPLERAIYGWIYADSGSNWGHREAALLQDIPLSGQAGWGFKDNNGETHAEGFLGIYVRSSPDYKPFPSFASNYAALVVMNIFDPVASPTSCHYNVTLDDLSVGGAEGKVPTLNVPVNTWAHIGLNTVPVTGSTVADIIGDDVTTGTYGTDWTVYRYDSTSNAYFELTPTDPMLPGVGYWFMHVSSAVTIDMRGSSSGVHVTHTPACSSPEGCFEIPLQANAGVSQWQMIGYPFRDSRNMGQVKIVTDSGVCSAPAGCVFGDSDAVTMVHNELWHYNGSGYQTIDSSATINPWDAAWVSVLPAAEGLNPRMLLPASN